MVHKKYIKQGDKKFGPYLYETKRVNGKIVTTYLGKANEKKKRTIISYFVIGLILLSAVVFLGFNGNITGGVIFEQISDIGEGILDVGVGSDSASDENAGSSTEAEGGTDKAQEAKSKENAPEKELPSGEKIDKNDSPVEGEIVDDVEKGNKLQPEVAGKGSSKKKSDQEKPEGSIITDKTTNKTRPIEEDILNETIVEELGNETIIVNTTQFEVKLGEPVRWIKRVENIRGPKTLTIEIPISIRKLKKETREENSQNKNKESEEKSARISINDKLLEESKKRGIFAFFELIRRAPRITGLITQEGRRDFQEIFVEIAENENGVELEYYTAAPYAIEEELENGKRVKIVGPDDVHYENVLVFTNLSESLNVVSPERIIIYWEENDTYLIPLNILDLDSNGVYDYVEWIAPHLSNQTFDIIVIVKAEHLDSNRTFISDIFEEVRELDGNWSETIPSGDYVRVVFEIPLDSTRDITVYPRTVSGTPRIEVYEVNQDVLIAEFTSINDNEYNKVLLTNLQGSQDTFDLRVLDGDVEFDHIIDPTQVFFEDCDTDFSADWDINGTGNFWQVGSGAEAGKCWSEETTSTMITSAPIDLSTYNLANLSLTYDCDGTETGEGMTIKVNSSVETWITLLAFTNGVDDTVTVEYDLGAQGLSMTTGVHLSADFFAGGNNEDCDWDNINLTGYTLPDAEYPVFSAFAENPTNNTAYSSGALYEFNATVLSTNETVGIEFDGVNYSAQGTNGGDFNVTLSDLAAGVYTYYWFGWGNGTDTNFNRTTDRSYTIAKATGDVEVYLNNATANLTIELGSDAVYNASVLTGEGKAVVYEDGTLIANATASTNTTTANTLSSINITAILFATENYTRDSQERFIDVQDTTNPVVSIVSPSNTTNTSDSGIDVNFTMSDLDLDICWYTNSSGQFNYTITCGTNLTTPGWDEGTNVVVVYANDTSGNEASDSVTFSVDTIAPDVSLVYPTNTTYASVQTELNYTVSGTDLDSCWYSTDGGQNNNTIAVCGNNVTGLSSSEGSNTWLVYTNDTVGNENSSSVIFAVDTTPPGVTINQPTNITYTSSDLPILFNVTTNEDATTAQYSLDGGINNVTMQNNGNRDFNATNDSIADGTYTVNYYVNDTLNNFNNTESRVFSVDITNPAITSLTENPADPATYVSGAIYEFNSSVTDTNLETVLIEFDATNYTVANGGGNIYNFTIVDLAAGTYNYYWRANDTANNVNVTAIQTYTINNATGDVTLLINGSAANQTAIFGVETNASTTTLYGTVTLYRNGVDVSSQDGELIALGVGDWNFTAVSSGDQNHSSASVERWSHILRATSEVNLTLNSTEGNITIDSGDSILLNGTLITGDSGATLRLYNDGTLINEGTIEVSNQTTFSTGGFFNITVIYVQSQNYSGSSETYWVNVTGPSDSEFPIFSSFTENPVNNTVYASGATYKFNSTITSTNSTTGVEFGGVNYTATNTTASLFNFSVSNLAAGTYTYYWWSYGNGTNTNFNRTTDRSYTVAKATGDVEVYLDGNTANITVELGSTVTYNASVLTGEITTAVYEDGILIANGTATTNTTTANSLSSINITSILPESQNYTGDSQERWIDVEDTIFPLINIVTPDNSTNHSISNVDVNYTVSDSDLQTCWYTNSSGQFNYTITCGNNLTTETWDLNS